MSFKEGFRIKWHYWKNDIIKNKRKIILAALFYLIALVLDYIAGTYTERIANVKEVNDLILDYVPAINLSFIFVWLFLFVIVVIIIYPLIFKPSKIHYYLGMFGSFVLIRSIFITLTHLKTPAEAVPIVFPFYADKLFFLNDMFFSGHTGLPFLGYLLTRKENKPLSYFFLVSSIVLAATSILTHRHYSIDVFAAFFITYGIYVIANKIFNDGKSKNK